MAKRLEIDYAPAMVGFEFRNGRSTPVYDGIVVCAEFKDIMLEVNLSRLCCEMHFLAKFETLLNLLNEHCDHKFSIEI